METFIGIFGLIIATLTFWYSFLRKPIEEITYLKTQFKSTQKISKEVQTTLEEYINENQCSDLDMYPNISFGMYLTEMKCSYQENLSDELYNKLDQMKLTKPIIESMTESLKNQFNALQQIQVELRMRRHKKNI